MEIEWNTARRRDWDDAARHAAWQQNWAYGAAIAAGGSMVHRATILEGGERIGLAQFTGRTFFGRIHAATCTRGPVWLHDVPENTRREAYRHLRRTIPLPWARGVFITPEAAPEEGETLRKARLCQVMSPYSTATIDLTPGESVLQRSMNGKWRNRLRRAEDSGLTVTRTQRYDWLLDAETEQQRTRRYSALPPSLVRAWQKLACKADGVEVFTALQAGERVGAMLFLRHGAGALYHIGTANAAGRAANAHNLILWHAIRALRAKGIESLDLGGLDTVHNPGIARFKLGAGGQVRTLCGTWY